MTRPRTRVALFTNFHPDIGGGSVNLRSILAVLPDLDVTWFHLGSKPASWPGSVWLGENLIGGPPLRDILLSPLLLGGIYKGRLRQLARQIIDRRYDVHWVVAMNEGIVVGNLLARADHGTPLHVSVQDDQAAWMWCRSRRYKWLTALVKSPWKRLLKAARSVDVTSFGMQQHYGRRFGLESVVVHPYVEKLPELPGRTPNPDWVEVGHIGSVYDLNDFAVFLRSLRRWTKMQGKKLRLVMIGLGTRQSETLNEGQADAVENIPSMSEPAAVQRLHRCDFVYAMYPFRREAQVFRQTSLPTKLSTYVQAQRPVLAHTPADSSLAAIVGEYGLGVIAAACDEARLAEPLAAAVRHGALEKEFERAREELYGYHNVETVRACLET